MFLNAKHGEKCINAELFEECLTAPWKTENAENGKNGELKRWASPI